MYAATHSHSPGLGPAPSYRLAQREGRDPLIMLELGARTTVCLDEEAAVAVREVLYQAISESATLAALSEFSSELTTEHTL